NVRDPQADVGLQCAVVDRLAGLLVDQHLTKRLATRDAAGMRRQNSIRARVHLELPANAGGASVASLPVGCVVRRSGFYPIPTPFSSGITSTPRRLRRLAHRPLQMRFSTGAPGDRQGVGGASPPR